MRGSLRQRSPGSWELRAFAGRDATGKRRYVSRTVRGDKAAAEEALAEMVETVRVRPEEATVRHVLERWFEEATRSMKTSTVATTRVILDAHLLPHIGEVAVAELSTEGVEALYRRLAEGGGRGGGPLSGATVRRAHNVLHRALAQAVDWGWLKANPAGAAPLPEQPARQLTLVTAAVVQRLLAHCDGDDERLGLLIRLAALTGARRGQLLALRWSDLGWTPGTIMVVDTAGSRDKVASYKRELSLDPLTLEIMRDQQGRAEAASEACGVALNEDAFVFSASADSSVVWSPSSVTQAFARLAELAGVPEVRLDDLRHFAAAQLLSAGADARSVAARLWTGSSWPSHLPSKVPTDVDRVAAETLAQLLQFGRSTRLPATAERRRHADGNESHADP